MTSYNTLDGFVEGTVIGIIRRIFEHDDNDFLLRDGKTRYWCRCSAHMMPDVKDNLGKEVTVTGLVEVYCGNAERMNKHIYEMIVGEIR